MNLKYRAHIFKLTSAGLLIAIGIIIPMFSPIRILIEPASYTLASHVAVFVAMFISPGVAIAVAIGTTLGFFWGGFPLVVVLRAASQIVFVLVGAYFLKRIDKFNFSGVRLRLFSFVLAIIHAVSEFAVVVLFAFGTNSSLNSEVLKSFFLLVGLGTVIHSMVDFEIANFVRLALQKHRSFKELASK